MSMLVAAALGSSTSIVAYLVLFTAIGFAFVFVNLLVGYFLRPADPHPEKQEIYECGEPTIGSSFVQFDLRFYVVALVFIIFDVEVAFLFPWGTVFGKATTLMHTKTEVVQIAETTGEVVLSPAVAQLYRELGVRSPGIVAVDLAQADLHVRQGARQLATLALCSGLVFFVVLFVGFAYEWKTGALDWVRAIRAQHRPSLRVNPPRETRPQTSVLST